MKGIIPRIIETIFQGVEEAEEKLEFLVKVSYIEIYMEKIRDLINRTIFLLKLSVCANNTLATKNDLKVRENRDKSVYIENVTEVYVACHEDVMKLMEIGQTNRKVSATSKFSSLQIYYFSNLLISANQK